MSGWRKVIRPHFEWNAVVAETLEWKRQIGETHQKETPKKKEKEKENKQKRKRKRKQFRTSFKRGAIDWPGPSIGRRIGSDSDAHWLFLSGRLAVDDVIEPSPQAGALRHWQSTNERRRAERVRSRKTDSVQRNLNTEKFDKTQYNPLNQGKTHKKTQ